MNDQTNTPQDDELEGFDTFEDDTVDVPPLADEPIDDADFQDISDDVDADVFGEGEPAPAPKKKTNWFNIGIAVVAVAVAGGLIFMKLGPQFLGGGDAVTPINTPAASTSPMPGEFGAGGTDAQTAAQVALAPNGKSRADAKTPGLLDSPDQFANLNTAPTPPAAPAQAAPAAPAGNDPFAGLPNAPAGNAPVADKLAASPAIPAPAGEPVLVPSPAANPVPMPAPISAAPTPAPVAAQPVPPAPAPITAAPVAAVADNTVLESKVSSLESRLDEMDSKLSAIAQAPAANDSRLNSIQTTLERLESRLDTMATSKPRAVSAPAPSAIPDEVPDAAPVKKAVRKTAAKPKKPQTTQWDKPYNPDRATPVATGNGAWELRGATPGRATLARGSDIREVGIGETLPGLGEITGVAQIGGRWVVQGTQGRLAQ